MDGYEPRQDSTYALTLFRHEATVMKTTIYLTPLPASLSLSFSKSSNFPSAISPILTTGEINHVQVNGKPVSVDFWDTAGQERFNSVHPSVSQEPKP
jgi:GTPase SAR1 family protein